MTPNTPGPPSSTPVPSRLELDLLRQQAIEARAELQELRAGLALARDERTGDIELRRVNEELVRRDLRAQLADELCQEHLRQPAHMAERDPLTGLPNRALLLDRLVHTIAHARRRSERLGLLFIDLDGFKRVNDVHGHAAGDAVLQQA